MENNMSVQDQKEAHEMLNILIQKAEKAVEKAFSTKERESLKAYKASLLAARALLLVEVMGNDFK